MMVSRWMEWTVEGADLDALNLDLESVRMKRHTVRSTKLADKVS